MIFILDFCFGAPTQDRREDSSASHADGFTTDVSPFRSPDAEQNPVSRYLGSYCPGELDHPSCSQTRVTRIIIYKRRLSVLLVSFVSIASSELDSLRRRVEI